MKQIIIVIMFLGIVFAQSSFQEYQAKQPIFIKQTIYELVTTNTQVVEAYETNIVMNVDSTYSTVIDTIPAHIESIQNIQYHINMYDNAGRLMQSDVFNGNLLPHISQAEAIGLKNFVDKYNVVIENFFIK